MRTQYSGIYLLAFFLACGLIGCIPTISGEQIGENGASMVTRTSLPIVTAEVIAVPTLLTPTKQFTTSGTTNLSSPCSTSVTTNPPSQVSYHGVYPGMTTVTTLEDILGVPIDVHSYEPGLEEWIFQLQEEKGVFPIRIRDGMVTSIVVPDNMSLASVFRQYGCPDVIFAVDLSEHKSGQYSATFLVYLQLGIAFTIRQFPVDSFDESITTHYFSPGSLEDFLHENPSLQSEIVAKQVPLEEGLK